MHTLAVRHFTKCSIFSLVLMVIKKIVKYFFSFQKLPFLFSSKLRNIYGYMLDHPPFFEITTDIALIIKKANIESVLYSLLKNYVLNIFKTFLKWL